MSIESLKPYHRQSCAVAPAKDVQRAKLHPRLGFVQVIWNICLMGVVGATLHKING